MLPVLIALVFVMIACIVVFVYIYTQQDKKTFEKKIASVDTNITPRNTVPDTSTHRQQFADWIAWIKIEQEDIQHLVQEVQKVIVWMHRLVYGICIALLTEWHVLIQWAPWLAKTKTVASFAQAVWLIFQRIQFTPDMLPSDVVWVQIYNPKTQAFSTELWPIVGNLILADEINRTTPKVQAALLESMQEKQITLWWETHKLPRPFVVLATQNPLEQEWTYPLPEAQLDRFMCQILVEYPSEWEEQEILNRIEQDETIKIKKVLTLKKLHEHQQHVAQVVIDDSIKAYITQLVQQTRQSHEYIMYGASPRASIALMQAAKAVAYLQGRDYVTHDDVRAIYLSVMRHRIILTYEARAMQINVDDVLLSFIS